MSKQVQSNLFELVHKLESKHGRRYTYTEIAEALGVTHPAAKALLKKRSDPNGYFRFAIMAKLLDFFASQGMPITAGDLFTVADIDKPASEM